MAQTGNTAAGFYPTPHTYAFVAPLPEKASCTFPRNQLVVTSGGSLTGAATGGCPTAFYGIAVDSGRNLAAAANMRVFRFEQGREYIGPLAGTLGTANIGATAAISVNSVGIGVLTTGTGVSNSSTVRVQRAAPGWAVGDVSALVVFIPLDAAIA